MKILPGVCAVGVFGWATTLSAAEASPAAAAAGLGEVLPLWSCLPFAGMLLSIALVPLARPTFWHHHYGKVSAFWAAALGVPFIAVYGGAALHEIVHIVIADYVPFIILLWSLYTVSGGILLRGSLQGTPVVNTALLAAGTAIASWMGTTGAAMLLIRPFLRANARRKHRTFMVVFFIFLVGNIGGCLTPLGDPPLFLGFLHGVSFFWTFRLLPHLLVLAGLLLAAYFVLDTYYYRREDAARRASQAPREPLKLQGGHNVVFLAGIVGAVLLSGLANWGEVPLLGVQRGVQDWVRDGLLIAMGILSLVTTRVEIREDNQFTWSPIVEVALLFIGIFITMLPCLLILKAGPNGAMAFLIHAIREPAHYFWAAGSLSAFLDNAPTYLTFFSTVLGAFYPEVPEEISVMHLMGELPEYLAAVSAGSVFFGAFSYIGNAPNFMIRSIAEEAGTRMPSFFGYIVRYSAVFLLPGFTAVTLIFF